MLFPFASARFQSDQSAADSFKHLLAMLQHDTDLNTRITHASSHELSLQVRPSYFSERNSFLPNIRMVMQDNSNGSSGMVEYTLQQSTRNLLQATFVITLFLECLLLILASQLASLLLLLIPIGLMLFAALVSTIGLYVFSKQIHNILMQSIGAAPGHLIINIKRIT